jgi:hypothetical protein
MELGREVSLRVKREIVMDVFFGLGEARGVECAWKRRRRKQIFNQRNLYGIFIQEGNRVAACNRSGM